MGHELRTRMQKRPVGVAAREVVHAGKQPKKLRDATCLDIIQDMCERHGEELARGIAVGHICEKNAYAAPFAHQHKQHLNNPQEL